MEKIKIDVLRDYDGYFESWATSLAEELEKLKSSIKVITVNSGPYRNYGMQYNLQGDTLNLDFYSAVRTGFGSIGVTQQELAKEIVEL